MVWCSLVVFRCALFVVCCVLFNVFCLMFWFSLFVAHWLSFVIVPCFLALLSVCCLLCVVRGLLIVV